MRRHENVGVAAAIGAYAFAILGVAILVAALFTGINEFGRWQARLNEQNEVAINEIRIAQQAQLIKVEQQKAEIRVVEAQGIAQSQQIINATLTDKYLQHEAIQAQEKMANSPNHTTIYIPSGQNGIPIVATSDTAQGNK